MGVDKISPICLTQSYYDVLQKLRQIAPLWYYIHQQQNLIAELSHAAENHW